MNRGGITLVASGAAVLGVVIALPDPDGPAAIARHALALPVLVLGVAAMMLPSLYIGAATLSLAPPAREFAAAAGESLGHAGRVLLGFAAPLAFLVVTSKLWVTVWALSNAVLALAALVAVRSLWYALFDRARTRPMWIYLVWLAVGFAIGEHLFMATLNEGGFSWN